MGGVSKEPCCEVVKRGGERDKKEESVFFGGS